MSQITVNTIQLQALANKANQCVGANKLLEISNYIGIKSLAGTLALYTTDGENNLCVSMDIEDKEDIDVTVDVETFIKLINKITSDTVSLELFENALVIQGNGAYKLELKFDDNGDVLSFPRNFPEDADEIGKISQSAIQTMQSSLKSSLSTDAGSVYVNYYVGDFITSTDRAMMGMYDCQIFSSEDTKFLFNRSFVDLLALAGEDVVLKYNSDNNIIMALANNFTLTTKVRSGIEDFNAEGIKKMLSIEQESYCKIRKKEILDLLDRLSLFVSAYDDGAITLEFTKSNIRISSMSCSGVESIAYMESKDAKEKTIKINISRLVSQLKSYNSDAVELYYGSDMCIKLVDGDVTQVIALMR